MEVRERVCADQFVTFDSLVFSMLSEIGDKVLKLGWCHNVNPPPSHPFCRRVEPLTKFSKKDGESWTGSQFLEGVAEKEG